MSTVPIGETIAYKFECTDSSGEFFTPDVVQVSFVKDHTPENPTASLYEDVLTYGGTEPRDSQLIETSVGHFVFMYVVDRLGQWAINPRWTDPDLPAGGMKTSGCPILIWVVPTEHTFTQRTAMIPPGGGEPVSVPYATATTGGMLTDLMAVKFAGIPADAQSAAEVSAAITAIPDAGATRGLITTGAAAAAAVAYYAANWAVTDWYINGSTGSDSNAGTSSGAALATTEELSRRLAVAVPIAHAVTVHLAQGSYGTPAVRVIQSTAACPFDVIGEVSYTDIGTVTSYTDRVAATNTEPLLVASEVTDWSAHVGKRVDVLDGAQAGALAWIGKANANSAGVATAGVTRFSAPSATASYNPTAVSPANGSALSLTTLPSLVSLSIETNGIGPSGANATDWNASRRWSVSGINVGTLHCDNFTGFVDGCRIDDLRSPAKPVNLGIVARCYFVGRLIATQRILDVVGLTAYYCLLPAGIFNLNLCSVNYSLGYGTQLTFYQGSSVYDVGIFDRVGAAFSVSSSLASQATINLGYGKSNGYGVNVPNMMSCKCTATVTGTSGDVRIGSLYFPWTALPWVDGERSGEAALLVSGAGHTAESTSYVDVTVPYVLSTQKVVAGYKTFGGTTGSVLAKYVDATTIRVVSSSATDTSVVTWHILPVGDNAVIRS